MSTDYGMTREEARRLAVLEAEVHSLRNMQQEIHDDVKAMRKQMDRWGGMAFMAVLFGGFIAGLVAMWDKLRAWF